MRVPGSNAVPGLVLRDAVENGQGRMLLPAGTTLGERHVRLLRTWGVESIEVEDAPLPGASGEDAATSDDDLDRRFALVRGDPVLDRLRDVVARQRRARSR